MPRRVLLCPHCGGSDLSYEAGLITGQKYHCKRCDYVGPFAVERDLDEVEREAREAGRGGAGGGPGEAAPPGDGAP